MTSLEEIRSPIAFELKEFQKMFRRSMKSDILLLNKITAYMLKKKGKQLRPMFVFLTAGMTGTINNSTYTAASLIEMLHSATLIHDDVVDDADQRRGLFSIKALWKNKIAVLVGDYLLSRGLLIAIENKEFSSLEIVANAVREMSEGELMQIEKARRMDISEDIYYEIIRKKTASLIASCCAAGAASSGATDTDIEKMKMFGEKTGIAFQIRDDLFDLDPGNASGKPGAVDIKERKMTLPLIHTLRVVSSKEKRKIINIVKNHNTDHEKVSEVIEMIQENGGIDYAAGHMQRYQDDALDLLKGFPPGEFRDALEKLVIFTIQRNT